MLRTDIWKTCLYEDDIGDLFDLDEDPDETTNLFDLVEHTSIKRKRMARLTQRMMSMGQPPEYLRDET